MKRYGIVICIILAIVFSFTCCACQFFDAETGDDETLSFDTVYAMAQEAGYNGTLEELIELFKGDSAYDLAVKNGYGGTEAEWLESLKVSGSAPYIGENGHWFVDGVDTGVSAQGQSGKSIDEIVLSSVGEEESVYEIKYTDGTSDFFTVKNGVSPTIDISKSGYWVINGITTAYRAKSDEVVANSIESIELTSSVDNDDTYTITMTDGTTYEFVVKNGKDGTDGKDGENGKNGVDGAYAGRGLSAYELAVENGFDGTLQDWLLSLGGSSGSKNTALAASKAVLSVVEVWANNNNIGYSVGAGVIIKDDKENGDAYIITNYHVTYIEKMSNIPGHISDDIKVFLYGMELSDYEIPVTYIGGSVTNDIAVLKIEGSDVYKNSAAVACDFSDSAELVPGETAIAIGNPNSEGIAVTVGVISKVSDNITMSLSDGSGMSDFRVIRFDGSANEGNSGGGLFNGDGKLIGIVNAKDKSLDDFNYAIPSNVALTLANRIIRHCENSEEITVDVILIGITTQAKSSYTQTDEEGLTRVRYVIHVTQVNAEGVADGKLEVGDVLLSFSYDGGTTVVIDNPTTLHDYRFDFEQDKVLTFNVLRGEENIAVDITMSDVMAVR